MIVKLELSTFQGQSIGAVHWYGDLVAEPVPGDWKLRRVEQKHALTATEAQDLNRRRQEKGDTFLYRAGNRVPGYDDADTIRRQALDTYKTHFPDATLLLEARYTDPGPSPVLDGPDHVKAEAARLVALKAELYDHGRRNEPRSWDEYEAIAQEWRALIKEHE